MKNLEFEFKFAQRLAELMKESGLTQRLLELETGIPNQTISAYLSGKRSPSAITLGKLAKYFDVSPDYLIGISDYY